MFIEILKDIAPVVAMVCFITTFIVSKSSVTKNLRIWQVALIVIGSFVGLSLGMSLLLFLMMIFPMSFSIGVVVLLALMVFGTIYGWGLYRAAQDGRLRYMPGIMLAVYWFALISYPVIITVYNSSKLAEKFIAG